MRWAWLIGGVLILAAAGGVYYAFQSPTFVAGLTAIAAAAVWKAVAPTIAKPLPPEELAKRNASLRRGNDDWLRKRQGSLKD